MIHFHEVETCVFKNQIINLSEYYTTEKDSTMKHNEMLQNDWNQFIDEIWVKSLDNVFLLPLFLGF